MDMETNNFDVDVFISEIENRPAIWDMRSDLYSNRTEKTKAWEEVCLKLIAEFTKKNTKEKNNAAAQLQRKWKSLRDSYNRERNKQKSTKSGSGASGRKEYVYFQQLSFLSVLANTRPESQEVDEQEDLQSPDTPVGRTAGPRKAKKMSNVEKTELDILENINTKIR